MLQLLPCQRLLLEQLVQLRRAWQLQWPGSD
jgi:hypothetical protein